MSLSVSVVVPIYNERENIALLYRELCAVLPELGREYEILLVNDGSSDGSEHELRMLAERDPHVKIVNFRRNFGQTAAMQAGIQEASCDVIITMDGDLQNDPADIPMMLAKIDEGYDLVHGWRKRRQDTFLTRKLPSKIANWIISRSTGFPIHDLGCTLKAVRREIAQELELYGEMHRFIPILAHQRGARCVEVVTNHRARQYGQTKYGLGRTVRVVLDLLTVKYMLDYQASPMKLFGRIGIFCVFVAFCCMAATLGMKLVGGTDMTGNPLLLASFFSSMVAVQFISLGLLGEVSARIYFSQQGKETYAIRERINYERPPCVTETSPARRAA